MPKKARPAPSRPLLGSTLTRCAQILGLSESGAKLALRRAGIAPVGDLEAEHGRRLPVYDPAVAARLALDRSCHPVKIGGLRVAARAS
jgi:hypothetical protein